MSMSPTRIYENRYEIQERIGRGAMGEIYAAYDFLTSTRVALKRVFINPTQIIHGSSYGSNNPSVALAQEFRLLATLRHPHIISVLDFGFDHEQRPFYTMELLENVQHITQVETTVEGKLVLLTQLAHALAYLHRRGIIHRDLKPSNVLVEAGSMVRVLDFGLARRFHQHDNTTVGTIAYMPPEILSGNPATLQSDLFSFGLIAYEMLAGHHPFDTEVMVDLVRNLLETEPDFTPFFAGLTVTSDVDQPDAAKTNPIFRGGRNNRMLRQMIPIVGKLLAKRPERRHATATDVISDLGRVSNLTTTTTEWMAITDSYLQAATFIGREMELAFIERRLKQVELKGGEMLVIGGESGVGKTRLLDELRVHAIVDGMLVLRGESSLTEGLPYDAWRGPLRQLLLSVEISDLEASTLKTILPDVDNLLQRKTPAVGVRPDESFKEQLAALVTTIFQRLQRPALLLLEGLQADLESVGVLRAILPLLPSLPLLIIGTYRTDEGSDLTHLLPDVHHLRLPRFDKMELVALCTSVIGEYGRSPNLIDYLTNNTDGNPYLALETIRALGEEAGGLANIANTPIELLLQDGIGVVDQLVARRLGRLAPEDRPLLQLSAIVGRGINWEIISSFASKPDIDRWFFACTQSGVIEIQDGVPRFSHEKLRLAVLEQIEPSTRKKLHALVAEHFETQYPDQPARSITLVEHWRQAGHHEKMLHHARIALEYTLSVGLDATTRSVGQLLLDYLPQDAQSERLRIQRILGDVELYTFELDRAEPHYAHVLSNQQDSHIDDIVHALYGMSQVIFLRDQDHNQADAYLTTALNLVDRHTRPDLLPMIHYGRGVISRPTDMQLAWQHYVSAVQIAEQMDQPPRFLCYALNDLGVISYVRGDLEMATEYFHAVCAWSEEYGAFVHIEALGNLGDLSRQSDDPENAMQYYEHARDLAFQVGKLAAYVHQSYNLAILAVQQRDITASLSYIQEGLMFAKQSNDRGLGLVIAMAGVHALRGDYETAAQWIGLVQSQPTDVTDWTADCQQVLMIVNEVRTQAQIKQSLLRGSNLNLESVIGQIIAEVST